jgi:two-component system chemotaxis response regulator CheB
MNSKKTSSTKRKSTRTRQPRQPYLVSIGTSAGGMNAITELVSQLPADLNAVVLIVLHLSRAALGAPLAERIEKSSSLPCSIAKPNEKIKAGHIYLAVPGSHLLVKEDRIIIGHGPAENRFRPSIDVLFRSVAAHYRERAIGIVLTGMLNDGTSGMWAIKQSGGHCIVQDPNEAEYPDMPLSVLDTIEVDHCVSLKEMGALITDITKQTAPKGTKPPPIIIAESKLSEEMATGIENVSRLGEKTDYACPDCGGGLWKIGQAKGSHFRCHIGHSYTEKDLIVKQSEAIEQTLWVATRMMEERKLFLYKLAREHHQKGLAQLGSSYKNQGENLAAHVDKLKELLYSIHQE